MIASYRGWKVYETETGKLYAKRNDVGYTGEHDNLYTLRNWIDYEERKIEEKLFKTEKVVGVPIPRKTIPMSKKEIREARKVGIPENIISKMQYGYELYPQEKGVVNKYGKVYVHSYYRAGKLIRPQLRDLHR